jgi:hypothetical protein
MEISKTTYGVVLTVLFGVVLWAALPPENFRLPILEASLCLMLLAAFGWLCDHNQSVKALRHGPNGKRPMILIPIACFGAIMFVLVWILVPKFDKTNTVRASASELPSQQASTSPLTLPRPVLNQSGNSENIATVNDSPGANVFQSIISRRADHGLTLLDRQVTPLGNNVIRTTYTYGSESASDGFDEFTITLKFQRPYDTANSRYQLLNPHINMNGGLVPQPSDKSTYIISSGGMSNSYLILDFTAPYVMEVVPDTTPGGTPIPDASRG